jgi:hypothetical protein
MTPRKLIVFVVVFLTLLGQSIAGSSKSDSEQSQALFSKSSNQLYEESHPISIGEYACFLQVAAREHDPYSLYSSELENQVHPFWDNDYFHYEIATGLDDTLPIIGLSKDQAQRYCN